MAKSGARSTWYRDPWNIGGAAIAVGVLIFAIYGGVASFSRGSEPAYVSNYTPPPASTAGCNTSPLPAGAKVSVVGDSYVTGQQQGGVGGAGWPALLGAATGWNVTPVGVGGSGYAVGGFNGVDYSGPNFTQQTASTEDSALVIIFGGRNDIQQYGSDANYGPKVRQAIATAKTRNPNAPVVVFTSPTTPTLDTDGLSKVNESIENVATGLPCVSVVNTVTDGWFTGSDAGLIGADGVHPTDDGHRFMETRIQADLARLGYIAPAT